MKTNADKELFDYLKEVNSKLAKLSQMVSERNKTLKFKAIKGLLVITENKVRATQAFASAGGYDSLSVVTQKHLYDPIISWLESEAFK